MWTTSVSCASKIGERLSRHNQLPTTEEFSIAEEKVGLIPEVMIEGSMGLGKYGLLFTSERCIFFLLRGGGSGLGAGLGGAVGGLIEIALTKERKVDPWEVDVDDLAGHKKSISVSYPLWLHLRVKKWGRSYRIRLDYQRPDGKRRKLKGYFTPSSAFIKKRSEEGVTRRDASIEYIQSIRDAFEKAVPATLAHRMEWRI